MIFFRQLLLQRKLFQMRWLKHYGHYPPRINLPLCLTSKLIMILWQPPTTIWWIILFQMQSRFRIFEIFFLIKFIFYTNFNFYSRSFYLLIFIHSKFVRHNHQDSMLFYSFNPICKTKCDSEMTFSSFLSQLTPNTVIIARRNLFPSFNIHLTERRRLDPTYGIEKTQKTWLKA